MARILTGIGVIVTINNYAVASSSSDSAYDAAARAGCIPQCHGRDPVFAAEAGVPLAPVGTAAVVLPMNEQKKWVFKTTQNDQLIADALVGHMAKNGIKTVGFIRTSDPYGEQAGVAEIAGREGIKVVATERWRADPARSRPRASRC